MSGSFAQWRNRLSSSQGFTLVEIAIAVAILGVALATLVSLQSKYIDNLIYEKSLIKAALYGQYLMAITETAPQPPDEGTKDGQLIDMLDDAGYFGDKRGLGMLDESLLAGWLYQRTVTKIAIAPLEDAMRRIDLTISWGPSARENYSMVFFMRSQPERSQ